MRIYLTDSYKIENSYPLDEVAIDSLYLLYQPLIGSQALDLYMTLISEGKRMSRFKGNCYFSRLMAILTMSLIDFEKYMHVLEGIGLLRTYVKNDMNDTLYLFQIQSPLSLRAFFKNQLLQTLLYEALGQIDFDKTKAYFKASIESKDSYEETTVSFKDVFHIDLKKNKGKVLSVSDEYKNKESRLIELDYDMDMLYRELKNYQIPKSLFSVDDENIIKQFASIYSIDVLSMASIIKDSIVRKKLNMDLLKSNIKKFHEVDTSSKLTEVYLKQPMQYKINDNSSTQLMQHLRYLESITPYELLREKQGGKEPSFHDLLIVETLMVQLGLKPAVVNVLIEYVLGTNDNRLARGYCEAIASTWARKKIVNVKQAYEEAMMNKNEPIIIEDEKEELTDSSHEFDQLLNQLKEGKL